MLFMVIPFQLMNGFTKPPDVVLCKRWQRTKAPKPFFAVRIPISPKAPSRLFCRHPRHRALEENFLSLLEDYLTEKEAARVLSTVIEWGRYAELFAYDYNAGVLSLENPN